ncbi:intradiol ring-cleavage dioxygenase [Amycolatopsis sp. NPDC059657]|uniref:intradiol ring-cleavage dioxygenase n=1 Tax=Amycolatopsis sp. NPDC059657 TaxID=3346899 RepID=UPI00366E56CD
MDNHDRGLAYDLKTLLNRRRALFLLGGASLTALAACSSAETTTAAATTTVKACTDKIPEETAGPYPGDGSNGPNILTTSGIVRSDIRSSFGSASAVAQGIPLTIKLNLQKDCAAYAGAAIYLWHCDIDGKYSMYSQGVTTENYLRGVQEADTSGAVTFQSIFPAAYTGRWPHIHFEVYPDLAQATSAGTKSVTSQLALPEDVCKTVYATSGYETSVRNLSQTSLARDMVFRDGTEHQLATVTGDVSGYTATLTVAV